MLAREHWPLYPAPPLAPKKHSPKSPAFITCNLIQNKPLQILCYDHLRKTGGRGSSKKLTPRRSLTPSPAESSGYAPPPRATAAPPATGWSPPQTQPAPTGSRNVPAARIRSCSSARQTESPVDT